MPAAKLLAVLPWGLGGEANFALVVLVGLALLVILALLLFGRWFAHWRDQRDLSEVLRVLEDLRAGEVGREADVASGSGAGRVAEAANRLAESLRVEENQGQVVAARERAMLDATRDSAFVVTDTDGDIVGMSHGAGELFGWSEDEALGRPAAMLFEDEAFKDFLPKLARRSLRVRGISARSTLERRDGSRFPAELSVRMLRGANRESNGFSMVVRDISEQVHVEEQLRASEERYRRLVENLDEGVVIVRDGRMLYVNPAFATLVGLGTRELVGGEFKTRVATRDVLVVEDALSELESESGDSREWNSCLLDAHGTPVLAVRLRGSRVIYDGGPAVLLQVRDETLERRVEIELRRNEAQLDAVLEAAADGILVLSRGGEHGIVQMVNRSFLRMFGLGDDELLGTPQAGFLALLRGRGGGARAVAEFIASAGSGPRRESIELTGDETMFPGAADGKLAISLAPLKDRVGRLLGRVVACRDMTDQRRSQQELQDYAETLQLRKTELERAHDELHRRHELLEGRDRELNRLNEELRKLDEMKSNLLSNVSHELSTPLVSIRGYTEMILKGRLGPLTEEQRNGLSLALTNIDRLISMIEGLLSFSRRQDELGQLSLVDAPLEPLLGQAAELLGEQMRERDINFDVSIDDDLSIHADRDKVLQVLINLLSNAIKFNRQGGAIRVSARPGRQGEVLLRIQDSGIGIHEDQLQRIFEREYRVPSEGGDAPPGRGIGLSIVRDVVRMHGCRVYVESVPGEGSTFSLTLPRSRSEPEPAKGAREASAVEAEGPSGEPDEPTAAAPDEADDPRLEGAVGDEADDPGLDEAVGEASAGDDAEPVKRPRFRIIRPNDFGH